MVQGPWPAPSKTSPSGRVPITKIQRLLPPIGDMPPSRELDSWGKNWGRQTSEASLSQDRRVCHRSAEAMEELRSESPELMCPGNACDLWPQLAKDKLQFCRGLARSFKSFAAKGKKKSFAFLVDRQNHLCSHHPWQKAPGTGGSLDPQGQSGRAGGQAADARTEPGPKARRGVAPLSSF